MSNLSKTFLDPGSSVKRMRSQVSSSFASINLKSLVDFLTKENKQKNPKTKEKTNKQTHRTSVTIPLEKNKN